MKKIRALMTLVLIVTVLAATPMMTFAEDEDPDVLISVKNVPEIVVPGLGNIDSVIK